MQRATEKHPLGNFVPKNMKYLLLGSFAAKGMDNDPKYDWHYGSRHNQFWFIVEQVYGVRLPSKVAKTKLFTKLKFGVADIISECERGRQLLSYSFRGCKLHWHFSTNHQLGL